MREIKAYVVVMCVCFTLCAVVGCTNVTANSYKTLRIAEVTHNAIIDSADDAFSRELITFDDRARLEDCDRIFQASFNTAKVALQAYAVSEDDVTKREKLVSAVKSVVDHVDTLREVYTNMTQGVKGVKAWTVK